MLGGDCLAVVMWCLVMLMWRCGGVGGDVGMWRWWDVGMWGCELYEV